MTSARRNRVTPKAKAAKATSLSARPMVTSLSAKKTAINRSARPTVTSLSAKKTAINRSAKAMAINPPARTTVTSPSASQALRQTANPKASPVPPRPANHSANRAQRTESQRAVQASPVKSRSVEMTFHAAGNKRKRPFDSGGALAKKEIPNRRPSGRRFRFRRRLTRRVQRPSFRPALRYVQSSSRSTSCGFAYPPDRPCPTRPRRPSSRRRSSMPRPGHSPRSR